MPNTYVNKVITGAGNTLIDLSQDTVTSASHIIGGRVGHLADGSSVSGTGSKTVTYSLSNGVSTNVSPDSIITGEGLCLRLIAPSGYDLSNISVTMGGVDITSSVFAFDTKEEPTLTAKSITANGTYTASSDSADGYSSVTVNVSGGVETLTILPEQSVTATTPDSSGYYINISVTESLIDGENYIVTMDGEAYLCYAHNKYGGADIYMGDDNNIWGAPSQAQYPFLVATFGNGVTVWGVPDTSAHTVKIEKVISI